MALWNENIQRSKDGSLRKQDDLSEEIKRFFENQPNVEHYDIAKIANGTFTVDVTGSIIISADDLSSDGELFFRLGMVTGDIIFRCKKFSPSVIPANLQGQVIFQPEESTTTSTQASGSDDDNLNMGYISDTIPTQASVEKSLADAISNAINNGYDIDIPGLFKKIHKEKQQLAHYFLRIESDVKETAIFKDKSTTKIINTDIYVSDLPDAQPLKLTAIQKAFYLAFIYHYEGEFLDDASLGFWDDLKRIYIQLPEKVQDMETGLMAKEEVKKETMNGYRSNIRSAIKAQISNSKLVDEFAVEGYKGQKFKVAKSTPAIRTQLEELFGLPAEI